MRGASKIAPAPAHLEKSKPKKVVVKKERNPLFYRKKKNYGIG